MYRMQAAPAAPQPQLAAVKHMPAPVYSLDYAEVTAEGVRELVVLTADAVSFFQVRCWGLGAMGCGEVCSNLSTTTSPN